MKNKILAIALAASFILLTSIDISAQKNRIYPNQEDIISPAEYDPADTLLLSWPKPTEDISHKFKLIEYYIDLIENSENIVNITINFNNIIQKMIVKTILLKNNVALQNITFSITQTNTIWIRDYGPFFIFDNSELKLVDFHFMGYTLKLDLKDEFYPTIYGLKNRIKPYVFTNFLIGIQGGNYMSDGNKTGFVADRIFKEDNPKLSEEQLIERMKKFLGLNKLIVLKSQVINVSKGGDGNGHLDMFAKIINEDTILVGQYNNTNDTNYQILEDNADYLESLGYNVVRIPMLRSPQENRIWTYTNSLIINNKQKKAVLVPTYNVSTDQEAISIYEQLMPDYQIKSVYSKDIINLCGAVHCTTMTVPRQHKI